MMRLSLRFIVPLALALGAIAYGVAPLVDDLTLKWFVRDLDIRANPATGELWGNFPQTYSMVGMIKCATRLSIPWHQAF